MGKQIKKSEEYATEVQQFGLNIKNLRVKKKFTQLELANETKLGLRTIQRIENGQITTKLPIIFILAETFEVPVATLFKGI
jgi:transcriptional regulator with XRE-family HTH domain